MARPRYQDGSLFIRGKHNKVWVVRWREDLIREDGSPHRTQRIVVLGSLVDLSRREARSLLQKRVSEINQGRHRAQPIMTFEKFAKEYWQPGMHLALKPGSARIYEYNLDRYVLPAFGTLRLCDLNKTIIQHALLDFKRDGYSGSTIHSIRVTLAKVLQTAVELGYLDRNPAHGIKVGGRASAKQTSCLQPAQIQELLKNLPEPCRNVVLTSVLTGMRIGEVLALRWGRLNFCRGTIEISATYSNGQFGSPKTRRSNRVIPMSSPLRHALESQQQSSKHAAPSDLVFCKHKGTPLSPKNLYNRALAPTCDRLGFPRVSWHPFRHASGTLIGELGESIKTVQAILGHSDVETTLNIYMHAIPDSQRRAVERVAGVLLPDVPNLSVEEQNRPESTSSNSRS